MTRGKAFILVLVIMIATGCAMVRWRRSEIYPMSFDQTYKVALTALDAMQEWEDSDRWHLVSTDQTNGVIEIGYESLYMPEASKVKFILERIEPFETKVSLYGKRETPFTQKFFKAMDRRVNERILTYPS